MPASKKNKNPLSKNALLSSAANFSVSDGTHALKKLGLIALEQRILLDGAGFATVSYTHLTLPTKA